MKALLPIIFACAGLVSIAIVVIFELRKTPQQGVEMVEREDEAMSLMVLRRLVEKYNDQMVIRSLGPRFPKGRGRNQRFAEEKER